MAHTYKVILANQKEFSAFAKRDPRYAGVTDDNLGFADPVKRIAYVQDTLWPALNHYLINHEFEHLLEDEGTDEDEFGIRHKRGFLGLGGGGGFIRRVIGATGIGRVINAVTGGGNIGRNLAGAATSIGSRLLAPFAGPAAPLVLGAGEFGSQKLQGAPTGQALFGGALAGLPGGIGQSLGRTAGGATSAILGRAVRAPLGGFNVGGPLGGAARAVTGGGGGPSALARGGLGVGGGLRPGGLGGAFSGFGQRVGGGLRSIGGGLRNLFALPETQAAGTQPVGGVPLTAGFGPASPLAMRGAARAFADPFTFQSSRFGTVPVPGAPRPELLGLRPSPILAPTAPASPPDFFRVPMTQAELTRGGPVSPGGGVLADVVNRSIAQPASSPGVFGAFHGVNDFLKQQLGLDVGAELRGAAGDQLRGLFGRFTGGVPGGESGAEVPGFGELPSVQALRTQFGDNPLRGIALEKLGGRLGENFTGIDPLVEQSIRRSFDNKRRLLTSQFKTFRPNADIATDSEFRQMMLDIDREEAETMAQSQQQALNVFNTQRGADIAAALGIDTNTLKALTDLAGTDINRIMLQLGIDQRRAEQFQNQFNMNRLFGILERQR